MSGEIKIESLPEEDSPDYFRLLVRNCIETYKSLPNDVMCLDYNRISGKLRALLLDDEEYKRETRNIYAKQRLDELREIDALARLALDDSPEEEEDGEDEEDCDPRNRGRVKNTSISADKNMLDMRFKAAQMRRDLIASMNENSSEQDAVNFLFVPVTRQEMETNIRVELDEGYANDDKTLSELTSVKETAPEGTSGKIRSNGQTEALPDEEFFDVLESGEVVER
jgi:hypothetical protein